MNKKKVIIIVVATLLALLIAGGVLFFILRKDKDDKKDDTNKPVKIVEITITFDADGGEKVDDMTIEKGKSFQLPSTTKEGYTFEGWYNGSVLVTDDDTDKLEKDTLLTAKWVKEDEPKTEVKTLTVSFDSNGGSKVSELKFKCSSDGAATLKNLPKPKKDSYEFRAWEDKFGKAILDGAKITCDGDKPTLKLYAAWEYDGPTANPEQKPEDSKTYKCPTGYTLNSETKKCTTEGTVSEKCPSDTKVDGTLCIKTTDTNAGTRVCKEWTVSIDGKGHTSTEATGDFYMVGNSSSSYGKCAYHKWEGIPESQCNQTYQGTSKKVVWVSELHACYAETKMNNYETVCSSDYQYYSSSDLSSKFGIHDNGKCLKKVAKEKYCAEGYTLTSGKCIKTVEATLE